MATGMTTCRRACVHHRAPDRHPQGRRPRLRPRQRGGDRPGRPVSRRALGRQVVMPVVITLRNVPYAALVTVLVLAFGDTLGSKVAIVVLAGFFPRPGQHLPRAPGRGLRGSGPHAGSRRERLGNIPPCPALVRHPLDRRRTGDYGERPHHRGHRRRVDDVGEGPRLRRSTGR